jgi:hypothetical protein
MIARSVSGGALVGPVGAAWSSRGPVPAAPSGDGGFGAVVLARAVSATSAHPHRLILPVPVGIA